VVTKLFSSLIELQFYSKSIDLTCSISGGTVVTYSLQQNGVNSLPGWVILDDTNALLNITTPSVDIDTNYTFNIISTVGGTDYPHTIYLQVQNKEEKEEEEAEIPTSIQTATSTTQATAAVGIVATFSASFFSGASPQGAWSMINQIQLFLILPILMKSMSNDVKNFINNRLKGV
jgi:hypothetical protein